ncbi:porin PorA family protein [Corynebacterium accolens]|uniref:porin PorA family protein n=1 Tax=Corynebacterium accolens TaxID=38284 RepID=UPI0025429DB2|nr:porin PorA family protein [Corynebacterium accolens]MDK4310044.1 porin PorA family protein [Corynebacterium accolens]
MSRYLWPRSPRAWVVIAAIIFLLIGTLAPTLYNNRTRPLGLDKDFSTSSGPTDAVWMDVRALMADKAPADAMSDDKEGTGDDADPRCADNSAPVWCYQHHGPMTLERTITTGEVDDDDTIATTDSVTSLLAGNAEEIATMDQHSVLNRESTFPVAEPVNKWALALPEFNADLTRADFERDGLTYFFPSGTEQRSYAFFDFLAQESTPMDFTGDSKMDGIPIYSYHQDVQPLPLKNSFSNISADLDSTTKTDELKSGDFQLKGPASRFYDRHSRELLDLDADATVIVEPFYTVGRDISVEPTTGTIIDVRENVKVFFATDIQQAGTLIAEDDTEDRSVLAADFRWSEDTRADRLAEVRPVIYAMRGLMAVGWLGKAIGVSLLIFAAYQYMRRHRDAHDAAHA